MAANPIAVANVEGGATLPLQVTAGAARDRIVGPHDGRLKVSVCCAPERGKANRAVLRLLAAALDLPVRDLEVAMGFHSPVKVVLVRGVPANRLLALIEIALRRN